MGRLARAALSELLGTAALAVATLADSAVSPGAAAVGRLAGLAATADGAAAIDVSWKAASGAGRY